LHTAISAQDLFWFAAGLLTALAAGFVLAPLMPSGQSLRARLSMARWPLVAGSLIVALALTVYIWCGSPDQANAAAASMSGLNAAGPEGAPASKAGTQVAGSMEAMLTRLQDRLAKQGGSDADWELLAQSYDFLSRKADADTARTRHQVAVSPAASTDVPATAVAAVTTGANTTTALAGGDGNTSARVKELISRADSARRARDYAAATAAYQQLVARGGMTAQSWADYADITASLNGDRLAGAAERYVDAALAIDPHNQKALWLKASAQHESKRYAEAIGNWQQLLQLTAGGSADAKIFAANLAEDEALAGSAASAAAAAPVTVASASNSAGNSAPVQVSGEVALADALRNQVPSGLTLFIVAKSLDSPGPPVAVVRTQTGQWPLRFLLDDSLAMMSSRTLSKAGRVSVEARISQAGTAIAQSGDFQSAAATVDPREHKAIRLVIDRVIG
jgi:cytochrome c-type biogenesis protein CcmH/NrfG